MITIGATSGTNDDPNLRKIMQLHIQVCEEIGNRECLPSNEGDLITLAFECKGEKEVLLGLAERRSHTTGKSISSTTKWRLRTFPVLGLLLCEK
ncbi:hypothetical protein NXW27_00515 [Phocaeicola dorei]|nr:hypothetical protein [Phocaeicola dorei]